MVNFAYKDYAGGITSLTLSGLEINYINNDESVLPVNPIISCECIASIYEKTGVLSYEDFDTTEDDEILLTVIKGGVYYIFHGFVVAEEGSQDLHDAPYIITIRATDALGLLKDVPLTTPSGTSFAGKNRFIEYIGGALSKANPDLTIKTWCNIYESSMDDRGVSTDNDMFFQAKLDYRLFYKDANTFVSCYDALKFVLSNHCTLFYYLGTWNIVRVGDLQSTNTLYYTEYDTDGQIISSGTGDTLTARIGRSEIIHSINRDNQKSRKYAQKSVKLTFNYKAPENLVNNQKLTDIGALIVPLSGVGYSAYQMVGWSQYKGNAATQTPTSVKNAYIKTETDAFGYETERYYVIEHDSTATAGPLDNFIRNNNTDFKVHQGDKFSISFQHRLLTDISGGGLIQVATVALLRDGQSGALLTDWHFLDRDGIWAISSTPIFRNLTGSTGDEAIGSTWFTISIDDATVPVNGTIFVWFGGGDVNDPNESHFKDLQITYTPYINGSYRRVLGDFNSLTQTNNYKNKIEEEIFVSDSPKRILSGAIYESDGLTLATPTWYRYGVTEAKRYTQLVAEALFNLNWRRFRKISGSFRGFDYQATSGIIKPFGLMTKFEFVELADERQYLCINPRMNLKTGQWTGTHIEIFKDGLGDGQQENVHEFNYIF
jgi:hypothetical protein